MSALNNNNIKNTLEGNLERKLQTGYVEDESQLLGKERNVHSDSLDKNRGSKFWDQRDLTSIDNSGARLSQGYNSTTYVQSGQRSSLGLVRSEPTIIETIQKNTVVHEHIHPVQKEEVQPIIYREREQLDIKQVTQMLHETEIRPTILQQRELPAERREAIIERAAPIMPNSVLPTSQVFDTTLTQQIHAPIVNEVIRKTVLEEIQPVLERDVIQSTIIQNTQPIYEKIVEAPVVTREVRLDNTRRLSQGYTQGQIYNGNVMTSSLQGQRLSGGYTQEQIYNAQNLQQGVVYNDNVQSRRLSQGYSQQQVYNVQQPIYNETIQQGRWSLNQGQNIGIAPAAGMNNTGLGMASSVPLATVAPQVNPNLSRGFNEQPNIYNGGFHANNLVTSVGLTGTHAVAGSVNTTGNNVFGNSSMSLMEQNLQRMPQHYNSGNFQAEKMREMEREQLLRQQTPTGFTTL